MNSEFHTYLILGFDHIVSWSALDHLLFVTALCAIYRVSEWKRVLVLVTAFTVGHSLTLALTALQVISPPQNIVETLIPVTILVTSLFNVSPWAAKAGNIRLNYLFALFFGLIHGMGFSGYFRSLLGEEANIILPLFSFNLGLECGQILIVSALMCVSLMGQNWIKIPERDWTVFISGACAGISITLIF